MYEARCDRSSTLGLVFCSDLRRRDDRSRGIRRREMTELPGEELRLRLGFGQAIAECGREAEDEDEEGGLQERDYDVRALAEEREDVRAGAVLVRAFEREV